MYSSRRRDAHLPGHRPAICANLLYIISVLAGGALGNATGAVGRLLAGLPAGVHRQRTLRRSGHLALRRALGARVPAPSKGKLCGAPRPHFSPFSRAIRRSSRRTIPNWELCIKQRIFSSASRRTMSTMATGADRRGGELKIACTKPLHSRWGYGN